MLSDGVQATHCTVKPNPLPTAPHWCPRAALCYIVLVSPYIMLCHVGLPATPCGVPMVPPKSAGCPSVLWALLP